MTQQVQLQPLEAFNLPTPDGWPRWLQRFDQFHIASGLAGRDQVQQVSTLLYCMGEEVEPVLSSTGVTADQRRAYDAVVGKFEEFFRVHRNVIFKRARCNQRIQQGGESAEQYIIDSRTPATMATCATR